MEQANEAFDAHIDALLNTHVRTFFDEHAVREIPGTSPQIRDALPHFRVLEIEPGPKSSLWNYVSLGAWTVSDHNTGHIDFLIITPHQSSRAIDLLTMLAYYHTLPQHRLGLGHTLPIGEPWLPGSACDHLLISCPYPYWPDFEICNTERMHIHLLWALPITRAERDFKVTHGLEALEQRFDEVALEYWQIDRASAV